MSDPRPVHPKHLLIVEDETSIREFLTEIFLSDFEVSASARGDEAIRIFIENRPNAVILDFELEGILRGDHLLKLINSQIPVFMMTARGELKDRLLQEGADGFFEKPFNLLMLRDFFIEKGIINAR